LVLSGGVAQRQRFAHPIRCCGVLCEDVLGEVVAGREGDTQPIRRGCGSPALKCDGIVALGGRATLAVSIEERDSDLVRERRVACDARTT
jgi:hypothetical protein